MGRNARKLKCENVVKNMNLSSDMYVKNVLATRRPIQISF